VKRDGDCFPTAVHLQQEDPSRIIVHGLPIHRELQRRFWHAWVEYDSHVPVPEEVQSLFHGQTEIVTRMVIDRSNGLDVEMPAVLYYHLGRIEQTWQFDRNDAVFHLAHDNHYGPWVADWEALELSNNQTTKETN
jgi:hypothetical protein